MKLHTVFAAVLALAGSVAANATTSVVFAAYTLSYDETTTFSEYDFSFDGGGGSTGFGWNVDPSVLLINNGGSNSATFDLPDFTITANAGWALSGAVTGFLGNFAFTEVGGATTSISATGVVSVDGSAGVPFGGALTQSISATIPGVLSSGYFSGSDSSPPVSFTSFSFTGGTLVLSAEGLAVITGQPQNKLEIGLIATPVPEPETAALMLAGLLTLGSLARRRGRG